MALQSAKSALSCLDDVCEDGRVSSRTTDRTRYLLPAPGARRRPHARRLDQHLRGPGADPRRVPRPHRLAPAPGPALPPEAALRPLRPGPAGLGRRPPPQPRLPRAPDRAAGAGLRRAAAQPRGADLLPAARPQQAALGAVAGRGAATTTASRSSARATTRWSTASPGSTSPPSSSTSTPSRRAAARLRRPGCARPEPTDLKLLGDALRERLTSPKEIVRGVRAALRGPRQVAARRRRHLEDGRRRHGRAPAPSSTSRSARTAASR